MKILLARPNPANLLARISIILLEPLELEYLYTVATQQGHECLIYDGMIETQSYEEVIQSYQPDFVALTGYITQVKTMLKYGQITKQHNPDTRVLIGGVHAELNYADFYSPDIDFIAHSGGIAPFTDLLDVTEQEQVASITGICFKNSHGLWLCNKSRALLPDDLPIPDRSHFYTNMNKYQYMGYKPCAVVKTAYGCPYNCSFCYCCHLNGGHYIARDIEAVVDEIASIHCENIHLVDDTFLLNTKRIETFIRLMKDRPIKKNIIVYSRSDFVVEHEALITELSEVGLRAVIVGLETVNNKKLDTYNKQSSDDANRRCVSILNKHGIECLGLFIMDIDAKKKDFEAIPKWMKEVGLRVATVSIFTPFPGTADYQRYEPSLITTDLVYWDFLHLVVKPVNMSFNEFYLEFYKLYLRLYWIGKKSNAYRFIDASYLLRCAREFIREVLHR